MKFLVRLYEDFRRKNPGSNLNFVEWKKMISIPSYKIMDDFQIGPDGAFYDGEFFPEDEIDFKKIQGLEIHEGIDDPDEV